MVHHRQATTLYFIDLKGPRGDGGGGSDEGGGGAGGKRGAGGGDGVVLCWWCGAMGVMMF